MLIYDFMNDISYKWLLVFAIAMLTACAPQKSCEAYDNYDQKQRELYKQ